MSSERPRRIRSAATLAAAIGTIFLEKVCSFGMRALAVVIAMRIGALASPNNAMKIAPVMPFPVAAAPAAAVDVAKWYEHRLTKSQPVRFDGPFDAQSAAFFIVHHGGDLEIKFKTARGGR